MPSVACTTHPLKKRAARKSECPAAQDQGQKSQLAELVPRFRREVDHTLVPGVGFLLQAVLSGVWAGRAGNVLGAWQTGTGETFRVQLAFPY